MTLKTKTNFFDPDKRALRPYHAGDDFYEALIDTHRDLSDADSARVNARLVLLLSNHIGDLSVLREAMQKAREGIETGVEAGERGLSGTTNQEA